MAFDPVTGLPVPDPTSAPAPQAQPPTQGQQAPAIDDPDINAVNYAYENQPPGQKLSYTNFVLQENKKYRAAKREAASVAEAANLRADAAEKKLLDLEAKKLEESNSWKERYELESKTNSEKTAQLQVSLIDTKIQTEFAKAGIDPDLIPLMSKSGITAENGTVRGVEEAIERFKWEKRELLGKLKAQPATGAQPDPQTQTAPGANPPTIPSGTASGNGSFNRDPATGLTYEELNKSFANGGRAPAGNEQGNQAPAKPDFAKMSAKERENWWRDYEQKLARR